VVSLRAIMRIYSYIFHGLLALLLLGVSIVAMSASTHSVQLEVLPWTGTALIYWLFLSGLFGLISVLLAMRRKLRVLFVLWSLTVVAMVVRGFFLTPYNFGDATGFRNALLFTAAAMLALLGALYTLRTAPARR